MLTPEGRIVIVTGNIQSWNIQTTGSVSFVSPVSSGVIISWMAQTGFVQVLASWSLNTITQTSVSLISWTLSLPSFASWGNQTEFQEALARMAGNGLTKFSTLSGYRPWDFVTRQEAAKMIGTMYKILWYSWSMSTGNCVFLDLEDADPTLRSSIIDVCMWGLFKGNKGLFWNNQLFTRAQTVTVLLRMFEGKFSNEQLTPWWALYYEKAKILGLTKEQNINVFERKLTREELALFLYRFKNIVTNKNLKTLWLNAISNVVISVSDTTGLQVWIDKTLVTTNLGVLTDELSIFEEPEFKEAIYWMKNNGLTKYEKPEEYRPFDTLLREEAAKIIGEFNKNYFKSTGIVNGYLPSECAFSDISSADSSLKEYVISICNMGLLKGINKKFNPKQPIIKSDFIAILVRMFEGKSLDETVTPWWKNYFIKAQELGLVTAWDALSMDRAITRYEVALLLYRFKIKYQLLANLNTKRLKNEIVSIVEGSQSTWTDTLKQGKIFIDTNILSNADIEVGYADLFGTTYKLVKKSTEKYFSNNFVWYGDIYTLDTDKVIGTVNFVVGNGYVVDGKLRPYEIGSTYYEIDNADSTQAYYLIKEMKK